MGLHSQPKVLVVDDDVDLRQLIRVALEEAGYQVREAAEGREAVRIVENEDFTVAVLDLLMPEQEGLETIRILRKARPDLGLIAISGGPAVYLEAAGRLGALVCLKKPFSCEAVVEKVSQLVGGVAR